MAQPAPKVTPEPSAQALTSPPAPAFSVPAIRTEGSSGVRDGHIDVLRGVAILLILILHAAAMTPGLEDRRFLHIMFSRFNCGMQLFFVLSGFLISRRWEGLRNQARGLGVYAIKRAGKIVPLYFLFLHLYIFTYLLLFKDGSSPSTLINPIARENFNFANYLAHLLFAQGLIPAWLNTLVDGGWSIVAEVYFYALFPLLLARYCRTAEQAFKTYVVTLAFAILMGELVTGRLERYYGYRNFFAQLPCFMLGVCAFQVLREPTVQTLLKRWAPSLFAFAVILAIGMVNGNVSPVGSHNIYGLVFAAILVSFSLLSQRDLWAGRLAILRLMGQQSYALFFTHIFLLKLQTYYLVGWLGGDHFWAILGLNLLTSVGVSFAVSAALIHPIDQFFVRWSSRASDRLRGR